MKIFITSLAILFASICFSQDYIPMLQEGNSWHVDIHYEPFKGDPYTLTRELILGDVVLINGIEYRQTLVSGNESCLLRENNGFVYKYSESLQEEYLLFDFTLEEGDVFNISESAYSGFPSFTACVSPDLLSWVYESELHVSSVDYVDIAGQNRKVITFEESAAAGYYYWIEGIGNWTGFDLMAETIDVTGLTIIACFTSNGETHFMFGATSCDNTTLQLSDILKNQIKLLPNPVTQTSMLQFPEGSEIDQIKIFDAMGKLITVDKPADLSYPIRANYFASGLYFYHLYSEGKIILTDKFLVK